MVPADIVAQIPDEVLTKIRKEAAYLQEVHPTDDGGRSFNWFDIIVRGWWNEKQKPLNGWFQWWD